MSFNAQNTPVVGAAQVILLPANPPQIITVGGPGTFLNFGVGKHAAVLISTLSGMRCFVCNGIMTGVGQAPAGTKIWMFTVGMGTTRVVVPENIQSIAFDNGAGEDISVWLEDHVPIDSIPCPLGGNQ